MRPSFVYELPEGVAERIRMRGYIHACLHPCMRVDVSSGCAQLDLVCDRGMSPFQRYKAGSARSKSRKRPSVGPQDAGSQSSELETRRKP